MKAPKYPYVKVPGKGEYITLAVSYAMGYHISLNTAKEIIRLLNAAIKKVRKNKKALIPFKGRKI